MPLNPAHLLPQAKALFGVLEPLERLGTEQGNSVLADVLFDMASIAAACGLADSSIDDSERMVIAVFLRYPFLEVDERLEIEAWRLLSKDRQATLLRDVNGALSRVPAKLPDRFVSVDTLAHVGGVLGLPDIVTKYCSHLYRFAQLVARAHDSISEAEAKILEQIWERLSSQQKELAPPGHESSPQAAGGSASGTGGHSVTLPPPGEAPEQVLKELDALIGLSQVKQEVRELVSLLQVQRSRGEHGLKSVAVSLHSVFVGPPGTGKTTVARLYGRVLRALGLLEKGQLVETDRAGLVAEYVGQTAPKVDAAVIAAQGGVLFIDEAYALKREGAQADFGQEAIETLLKRMEDKRDAFVVVAAGYSKEMEQFLEMNPGLSSRFPRKIEFPHYSAEDLERIFLLFLSQSDYRLSEDAHAHLKNRCVSMVAGASHSFGNARAMRNLFEAAVRRQASRLSRVQSLTKTLLETLESDDFPPALLAPQSKA